MEEGKASQRKGHVTNMTLAEHYPKIEEDHPLIKPLHALIHRKLDG